MEKLWNVLRTIMVIILILIIGYNIGYITAKDKFETTSTYNGLK